MRTQLKAAAAVLSLAPLLVSGVAFAQTEELYVIEQLTVSVNATADGSGERVAQIKSGDRVEVLEHSGDQARVKLATGEEGWVRASYLSANRPLREQLKASTEELDKLRQEKTRLEADLAAAKKAAASAAAANASTGTSSAGNVAASGSGASNGGGTSSGNAAPAGNGGSANVAAAPTADALNGAAASDSSASTESASADPMPSNPPLFSDAGVLPSRPSWLFALIAAAIALAGGFALGWRMLDRRIRAKYGGLRIY